MHSPSECPREDALPDLSSTGKLQENATMNSFYIVCIDWFPLVFLFLCSGKQKQGLMQGVSVNHKHWNTHCTLFSGHVL